MDGTWNTAVTVVLLSLATGRDTVVMWGYPLWLFLGLWLVRRQRPLRPEERFAGAGLIVWIAGDVARLVRIEH